MIERSSALAWPTQAESAFVDKVRIAFRRWPSEGARGTILLVHGSGAHSHWWDPVAPLLSRDGRHVLAIDLSGHGDSGWRDEYSIDQWARDVLAVMRVAGMAPVALVGHSLGGLVATRIATTTIATAGVIAVDAPIALAPNADASAADPPQSPHHYPTAEDVLARFRPVPPQFAHEAIATHIARASIRESALGWSWKFDPRVAPGRRRTEHLTGRRVPYAYVQAERGLQPRTSREHIESHGGHFYELPGAGHAPMLDQPEAFASMLSEILTSWGL